MAEPSSTKVFGATSPSRGLSKPSGRTTRTDSSLVSGFAVAGFWSAVGGALIYSVISWGLSALLLRK